MFPCAAAGGGKTRVFGTARAVTGCLGALTFGVAFHGQPSSMMFTVYNVLKLSKDAHR